MADSALVDCMKMTAAEFSESVERLRRDDWRASLKARDQRDLAAANAKYPSSQAVPEKELRPGTATGTTTSKARSPSPASSNFDAMKLSEEEFRNYVRGLN